MLTKKTFKMDSGTLNINYFNYEQVYPTTNPTNIRRNKKGSYTYNPT